MKKIIIIASIFYLCACNHLFYYPDSMMHVDLGRLNLKPQQIELQGPSGKLIGWYFEALQKDVHKPKIVLFHGNAQNISSHFLSLYWILEYGYDFLIFDYPGYGGSEGKPNQKDNVEAGKLFVRWMHKKFPESPIVIMGQSLGGNVGLETAAEIKSEVPLCMILADSTFLSYKSVARRTLAGVWWTWIFQPMAYVLVSDSYSASNSIGELAGVPLVVLHDDRDPTVGVANGRDLFDAASEPKEFWLADDGLHIGAFSGPNRIKWQKKFLTAVKDRCGE